MFDNVEFDIYFFFFFVASVRRWQILKDNVKGLTLKALSTTRWESHIESVKPLRFSPVEIREALLQLAGIDKKDFITVSSAKGLARNVFGDFEFLLSLVIWYEILFAFNKTSKLLQSDDMQISVAIGEVKGLIAWLDHYRESGFNAALVDASDMAEKLNVPAVFPEKRPIKRPRFFDESTSEPSPPSSGEELFIVEFFLYIVDQAKASLVKRFEQYQLYDDIFGFLFTSKRLESLDDCALRAACIHLESFLTPWGEFRCGWGKVV